MFDPDARNYTCGYNPKFLDKVYTQRRAEKNIKQAEIARQRKLERDRERQRENWHARPREFNAHVAAYLKHKLLVEEGMKPKQIRKVRDIIIETANEDGTTPEEITGVSRNKRIVRSRHKAMWKTRKERQDLSLPQIGRLFGGRDHTTVLHGIRRHEQRMVEHAC